MAKFRYNETEDFPIYFNESAYWYIIIKGGEGKPNLLQFSNSKGQSKKLVEYLKSKFDESTDIVLGSWTGKWSTDLFVLDPTLMIKKIEKELKKGDRNE